MPFLARTLGKPSVYRAPASIPEGPAYTVDATSAINGWLATVPDNARAEFPIGAQFRVDGTVTVQDRKRLRINANGSTFRQITNGDELGNSSDIKNRRMWRFLDGERLEFWDPTIIGANPFAGVDDPAYDSERESQHGIQVQGTAGFLVAYPTITDVFGDYYYVGKSPNTQNVARDVTCRFHHFERNGRQGVTIVGGEDVTIEDGIITENRRAALDMEPNDPVNIHRVYFRRNTIGPTRLNFISNVGDLNADFEDIWITDNTLSGNHGPDFAKANLNINFGQSNVTAGKRRRYRILRNVSTEERSSPTFACVVAQRIDDLLIEGNVQPTPSTTTMYFVRIGNCSLVRVRDNDIFRGEGSLVDWDGGNTDYCSSGNRIGNPLTPEAPTFPCS